MKLCKKKTYHEAGVIAVFVLVNSPKLNMLLKVSTF